MIFEEIRKKTPEPYLKYGEGVFFVIDEEDRQIWFNIMKQSEQKPY